MNRKIVDTISLVETEHYEHSLMPFYLTTIKNVIVSKTFLNDFESKEII